MRPVADFVRFLAERGISLTVSGSQLRVRARAGLIDDAIKAELAARKDDLITFLSRPLASDPTPLSSSQRRLWFLDKLSLLGHEYTLMAAWRITSLQPPDLKTLESSLTRLLRRHPILGCTIAETAGEPVLTPLPSGFQGLEIVSAPVVADQTAILTAEASLPFQLIGGPLFRVKLISGESGQSLLVLAIHHIISDYTSMGILMRDLSALLCGEEETLPPVPTALDGIHPRAPVNLADQEKALNHWRNHLQGASAEISLPFDRPRPPRRSAHGACLRFPLPASADLRQRAKQESLTSFMAYLAAFVRMLSLVSGQSDLVIGCPVSLRDRPERKEAVGFLVNTLAMRFDVPDLEADAALFQEVRRTVIGALEHQSTPFEDVVTALRPQRHLDRNPLFQALFVLQSEQHRTLIWPEASPVPVSTPPMAPEVDLSLLVFEASTTQEPTVALLEYDPTLFDQSTVEHLAALFIATCERLACGTSKSVPAIPASRLTGSLRVLPEEDLGQLLHTALASVPEQLAVLQPDGAGMTAGQLLASAKALVDEGLQWPGSDRQLVRIAVEAGPAFAVALVACLLAKRPFLVLPPSLEDGGRLSRCAELPIQQVIRRQPETGDLVLETVSEPIGPSLDPGLAYLCLTSGSTGVPKAVHVPERALRNHALSIIERFPVKSSDRVLAFAAPVFDVALEEILPTLLAGGCVVFAESGDSVDPCDFTAMLAKSSISIVNLPAPFWHAWTDWLVAENKVLPESLRLTITGSDRVRVDSWNTWRMRFPHVALLAGYGPTETTISTTFLSGDDPLPEALTSLPLGQPIDNVDVTVRDDSGCVLPLTCVGEIVIEGLAVAAGYGADQPRGGFGSLAPDGVSSFRTGDRGRMRLDGSLEFLGRTDNQVKIRGVRLNPAAIESVLETHPRVLSAAVLAQPLANDTLTLMAFYQGSVAPADLAHWARITLGVAAAPSRLRQLAELPRLVSGKIDRQALAVLPLAPEGTNASELPRDERELRLARVFEKVLNIDRLDRQANFFELGGDSLSSLRIIAEAARLGLRLTTEMVFRHQTIAAIAEAAAVLCLDDSEESATHLPLTPIMAFFHRTTGPEWRHFNQAMMILLPEDLVEDRLKEALHALIARHPALRIQVDATTSPPEHRIFPSAPAPCWRLYNAATDDREASIAATHASLNPSYAQNVSALLFLEERRLLLVIHHLSVDVLSWSVVLSDLAQLYTDPTTLPPQTGTSFMAWARRLTALLHHEDVLPSVDFWMARLVGEVKPLLPAIGRQAGIEADVATLRARLDRTVTLHLLSAGASAYGLSMDEILILAILEEAKSRNAAPLRIDLERNGRGLDLDDMDISRTVGWFTAVLPLRLPAAQDIDAQARLIRTLIDDQPVAGLGYGLAREFSPMSPILATLPEADLLVNYVGAPKDWNSAPWQPADESAGSSIAAGVKRSHLLELNAGVIGGELRLEINFPDRQGAREEVARWLVSLQQTITSLAHQAQQRRFPGQWPQNCLEVIPATPSQSAIYWHSQRQSLTYHDQLLFLILGPIDPKHLREAFLQVVANHDALRSIFLADASDQVHQIILDTLPPKWYCLDFSDRQPEQGLSDLRDLAAGDRAHPFDLCTGPMQRIHLVRMHDGSHRLQWSCHHLITDGWSVSVVMEEWLERYAALVEQRDPVLASAAPLADVMRARRAQVGSREWLTDLLKDGDFPRLADATAGVDDSHLPRLHQIQLEEPQVARLKSFAQGLGVSVGVLLQAAWGIVLGRLLDNDRVVFGLPMAGRPLHVTGADRSVGMFVNTLPVRTDVAAGITVKELLENLQFQAAQREAYSFTDVSAVLQSEDDVISLPFDTIMLVQNYPFPHSLAAAGVSISLLNVEESTEFVATLVAELTGNFLFKLVRDPSRLSHASAQTLLQKFVDALVWMTSSPDRQLGEFDKPQRNLPRPVASEPMVLFTRQVEHWAELAPDSLAIVDSIRNLTYADLCREMLSFSRHLVASGIQRGDRLLLALKPSADYVVAFLGSMIAGATVSALDNTYPETAKIAQINDYQPKVFISGAEEQTFLRTYAPEAIPIVLPFQGEVSTAVDLPELHPEDPAYLIYTSGSTGKPKGSFCPHRGLASLARSQRVLFALTPLDNVLQAASLAFDASVWEIALALGAGATLCIPAPDAVRAGEELASFLADQMISVATFPPSVLATLPPVAMPNLRVLIVAAEACPPELAQRWGRGRRFFNAYGPSEASICATVHEGMADGFDVPIGRAIPGVETYVTDRCLRPLPDGFAGELVIGGVGVGLGYWNRQDLTQERFPLDTLGHSPGGRLYRSGDRLRRDPDGTFHFLGRVDRQIKMRGFRIEPAEIESSLVRMKGVERAVAGVRRRANGEHVLVAWLVVQPDIDLAAVRVRLRQDLPAHLVPHHLLIVDSIPLMPSGKIDWNALPIPSAPSPATELQPPPSDELGIVLQHWRDVLPSGASSADANFFDARGDSLLLVKLLSLIAKTTGVRLRTSQVIARPSPQAIASLLKEAWTTRIRPESEKFATAISKTALPIPPLLQGSSTADSLNTGQPISIIGMAARFPGAPDLDAYRNLLCEGREGLSRLEAQQMLDAGAKADAIRHSEWVPVGGLLDDPETFDYEIFGISRKEATLLDPQHRIFLEAAWHALEDAGYPGRSTARDCGVFASCGMNHWLREVLLPHGESMEGSAGFHLATANEKDFLAPQIAYRLNLTGPALTVQTACSSSLVAIATAVSALRAGDCEMALAGGVSVPMPQGRGYRYEPDMILSPDGHCRPFSQEASGTVPSSGVGVVLLKSLDKALADGDSIHAVIRGIGTSNDGSGKMAFSAPGVEGQAKAIRCALADARLCQEEIDYIEAHGTGTPLGDPVEVLALSRIFNGRTEPLLLGSVKSMIGHCDAAAGVAGLIKTALALQEEQIPASLHVDQLNSKINFASGPFEVVSRSRPWPNHDRPRRAGVSSFGIGGTNAHVILESVPEKAKGTETPSPHLPIVLTGQTEEAISRQLEDITTAIGSSSPSKWPSIASTLWARASRLPLRRAFVIDSPADRLVPVSESPRRVSTAPKLAFLMPGQGSQSPSMADSLCRHATEFQEHLDSFSRRLEPHLGRSINDMLYGADSLSAEDLNNTRVAQPLILAVSVASARLWQARGLTPDALLGHSIGEIAAAHLAGVMDQETVIRFITARANLMARQPRGAMLAIAMTEEACRRFVRDDLCLAAVNGPSQCVLSGPTEQIESLEHELAESTTICRRLRVSHAFHSSMMTEAAEQLVDVLRGASLSAPRIPIVSTITGEWLTDEQAVDPQFWAGQLTRTVRFSSALSTLQAKGISLGLDLGPGRVVGDMARTCGLESVSSMGLDCNATRACNVHLQVIANLWERGVPFDLPSSSGRSVARLPGYPFSRFRCAPDRLNTSAENAPELRYYAPILESLPEPESFISPRLTFLTSDGNEWVTKAADVLRNLGADLRIHHRSSDKVSGSDCLAQERSDWDRAFRQMPAAPNTLVFLAEAESSTVNDLRGAIAPTLRLMGLIQALQHHYPGQPCRVISLTLSHGPTSPGLAASLAAGQIARVEHPEIDIQLIDSDSSDHISRALRHGLAGSPHEGPILLRRNGAFRQALQSVQPSPATSWTGLTRGSLLVTGGFGHLGPVLAYSLAAFNDVTVVLLGRTVHPEVAETFHSRGIPLRCHALDLANTPAVRELVQDLAAEGKPVRGVIHAAGVADFGGIILRRT